MSYLQLSLYVIGFLLATLFGIAFYALNKMRKEESFLIHSLQAMCVANTRRSESK